jgi:hypothetical protein
MMTMTNLDQAIDSVRIKNILRSIQPEMRHEHDAGDGHFSTAQVEEVEAVLDDLERKCRINRSSRITKS